MLRGMSAGRFQELIDFELMDSPELRMDLRFSILAAIMAAAGRVQAADGQPYSQAHFLKQMQACLERHDGLITGVLSELPAQVKQSVETQRLLLESWFSGINNAFREKRGDRPAKRPILPSSRALLYAARGRQ